MEQAEVEVLFCDLCGTSVPQGDVGAGRALRRSGKTIGACCLEALRHVAPTAVPAGQPLRAPAAEARSPLLAVLVAVAALATAVFVDHRLQVVSDGIAQKIEPLVESQRGDSQVVAGVALALDSVPRRDDVDALRASVGAVERATLDLGKRLDDLQVALAAVTRRQDEVIDPRPLLEDLRQRQIRILEQIGAVRAPEVAPPAQPAAAPAAAPAPAEPAAPAAAPADGVPAAFAEPAKKLASTDPAVRFEGVDDLQRTKSPEAVPLLVPMARDPDPFVRRLVVEGFAAWKRADVVEALLGALADGDEYVRDTAWRSLREVSGQKIPFEAGGAKDARARAVARWQDWWDKNKATFGS